MNKKLFLACVAVIVLIAVLAVVYTALTADPSKGSKTITVTVVHGNGEESEFGYTTYEEYLGDLIFNVGLVDGVRDSMGLYITDADGERAVYEENGAYWAVYVNGEYATAGVDTIAIHDGDQFSLVYTK